MKKSIIALSSGIIASLGLAFSIGMALYQAPAKTQALGTYSTDPSTYYSSSFVTSTHTGTALASDLHELMFDTHDTYVAYASLNTYLAESDQDPHDSDNIIGFWSNVSVVGEWNSSVWNKEHIWAQSYSNSAWTTSYGGADMHHIRPSDAMVNISRGNTAYGLCNQTTATQVEVNGVNTGSYSGPSLNTSTATVFEPRDSVKGDTARILLYMYMHYSTTFGTTTTHCADLSGMLTSVADAYDSGYTGGGTSNNNTGVLAMLLAWSDADPVDEAEMIRNNVAASYQGNRNPFVDFPRLAHSIWDTTPTAYTGLVADATQHVELGSTLSPSARFFPSSASAPTFTYSSGDSNILSVNGSTITALSVGTTVLTASYTTGGATYTASTAVTVEPAVNGILASLDTATIPAGNTLPLREYVLPSTSYNRKISWSSSNTSVASVGAKTGIVTGLAAGTCNIVCTTEEGSYVDSCAVTVTAVSATQGHLVITRSSFPSGALAYATSDTWTLGSFTGTADIYSTATQADLQMRSTTKGYPCNTTAIPHITQINVKGSGVNTSTWQPYLSTGTALTSSNYSSSGTSQTAQTMANSGSTLTWTFSYSSNYQYFYLNLTSTGAANIQEIDVYYGYSTSNIQLLYLVPNSSAMTMSYQSGDSLSLTGLIVTAVYDDYHTSVVTSSATYAPANGSVLTSSDTEITVTYSYTSIDGTTRIATTIVPLTVVGAPKTLSTLTLDQSSISIAVTQTAVLVATAHFSDGSTMVVTSLSSCVWSSSNTSVATVSSGTITAGATAGTATITASYTYGGLTRTATCALTVTATPHLDYLTASNAPDCWFGNPSYTPTSGASFSVIAHYTSGGSSVDVTSSCTFAWVTAGSNKVLGLQLMTATYTEDVYTRTVNFNVRVTNVGAIRTSTTASSGTKVVVPNQTNTGSTATSYVTTATTFTEDSSTYVINNWNPKSLQIRGNQSSISSNFYLYNTTALPGAVQSVTITTQSASLKPAYWYVVTGTSSVGAVTSGGTVGTGSTAVTTFTINLTNTTDTFFSIYAKSGATYGTALLATANSIVINYASTTTVTNFTYAEQASAMKDFLDGSATCSVTSSADVKRFALEYNAMKTTDVANSKTIFATLIAATQYNYGGSDSYDYNLLTGEYTGSGPSGSTTLTSYRKLEYIVSMYNTANPTDLVYLYGTTITYEGTDANGGSTDRTSPFLRDPSGNIVASSQSFNSLSITLVSVAASGVLTMILISGVYVFGKKKIRKD